MRKKSFLALMGLTLLVLAACGNRANGTYVGEGDIPFVSDEEITITIDGKEGTITYEASFLGSKGNPEKYKLAVDQKEKVITVKGSPKAKLTYELEDGNLKIIKDSSGVLTGETLEAKKD